MTRHSIFRPVILIGFMLGSLGLAFGVALAAGGKKTAPCSSPTNETVSVVIENPDHTRLVVSDVPWIENCTVALAMLNARHQEPELTFDLSYFCPWGNYVTSINGFGEAGDHFWALYVNGTFAQHGMDTEVLKAGDTVTWKVDSASATAGNKSHQAKMLEQRLRNRLDVVKKKD